MSKMLPYMNFMWCITEKGNKYPFKTYQYICIIGQRGKDFLYEFSLTSGTLALIHPMCVRLSEAAYYFPGETPSILADSLPDKEISLRFTPKAQI